MHNNFYFMILVYIVPGVISTQVTFIVSIGVCFIIKYADPEL